MIELEEGTKERLEHLRQTIFQIEFGGKKSIEDVGNLILELTEVKAELNLIWRKANR